MCTLLRRCTSPSVREAAAIVRPGRRLPRSRGSETPAAGPACVRLRSRIRSSESPRSLISFSSVSGGCRRTCVTAAWPARSQRLRQLSRAGPQRSHPAAASAAAPATPPRSAWFSALLKSSGLSGGACCADHVLVQPRPAGPAATTASPGYIPPARTAGGSSARLRRLPARVRLRGQLASFAGARLGAPRAPPPRDGSARRPAARPSGQPRQRLDVMRPLDRVGDLADQRRQPLDRAAPCPARCVKSSSRATMAR